MSFQPLRFVVCSLALLALAGFAPRAEAATGAWSDGPHTRARLVSAAWDGKGEALIGVQIELEKGWKTYWQNPGDAGVPPQLDWGKSGNLEAVIARWPVPTRLPDPYGVSIGYKGSVIVPVLLKPEQTGKPIDLDLEIEYGVCAEVCIPVTARLSLALAPGAGDSHEALIEQWIARTPELADPEAPAANGLALAAITPLGGGKTGLTLRMSGEGGLEKPDLLVVGPPEYYFTVPKLVAHKGGSATFSLEIDGLKSFSDVKDEHISLTLIDKGRAMEVRWPLGQFLDNGKLTSLTTRN